MSVRRALSRAEATLDRVDRAFDIVLEWLGFTLLPHALNPLLPLINSFAGVYRTVAQITATALVLAAVIFVSVVIPSALRKILTGQPLPRTVTPWNCAPWMLALLYLAFLLHYWKQKVPILYGVAEALVGCFLAWQNMIKATSTDRLAVYVGSVYLIKRGIDSIGDGLRKRREGVTDQAAAAAK